MALLIPVILSGGSGTRLWPLSRAMYPKQYIAGLGGGEQSLVAATLERVAVGVDVAAPIVICNNDHRFLMRDECERASVVPSAMILEPMARNTAPAIAVAALHVAATTPEAVLVVMPSDHVMVDEERFVAEVARAARVAAEGKIVLFGIKPTSAHTGYGYMKRGDALHGESAGAFSVAAFFEKPDSATAEQYVASGEYFWNSGIFVFRADVLLRELAALQPEILEAARAALHGAVSDIGFLRLDAAAFASSPSISIDYAVIEKTLTAAMVPLDIGWNDLGSWAALWDVAAQDASGNVIRGDAVLEDTSNCFIHAQRALVATIGVKDLVIVETPDAILVADKARSQDVSKVVARLKSQNRREPDQHVRNYRPWGFFETLNIGSRFQVKLLHVKPGGILSLQMHHHRSEHWIVVQGTARVTIENDQKFVRENESVYIVATQWHRLENPGKVPLELIEVQIGPYLGEDDIIRSDDIYARAPDETK